MSRSLRRLSVSLCLPVSLLLLLTGRITAQETQPNSAPTNGTQPNTVQQIEGLIRGLDADDFHTREESMRALMQIGRPAFAPLMVAIRGKSLEQAHRGMTVLEHYLADEGELGETAEETLRQIVKEQQGWAAHRADRALQYVRLLRQTQSYERLVKLGAEPVDEARNEQNEIVSLGLALRSETWKGSEKDLRLLRNLPALHSLSIFGPLMKEEQLVNLTELDELQALNLYATKLSNAGLAKLQAGLPTAKIDRRNGGMLGISGDPTGTNGCLVNSVHPNSAAEAAGLQAEDVITRIDNTTIDGFPELTKLIAEKSGGDRVKLEIIRNGEKLDKEVTLGEWKPEHLKNPYRGNTIILQGGQRIIINGR